MVVFMLLGLGICFLPFEISTFDYGPVHCIEIAKKLYRDVE